MHLSVTCRPASRAGYAGGRVGWGGVGCAGGMVRSVLVAGGQRPCGGRHGAGEGDGMATLHGGGIKGHRGTGAQGHMGPGAVWCGTWRMRLFSSFASADVSGWTLVVTLPAAVIIRSRRDCARGLEGLDVSGQGPLPGRLTHNIYNTNLEFIGAGCGLFCSICKYLCGTTFWLYGGRTTGIRFIGYFQVCGT